MGVVESGELEKAVRQTLLRTGLLSAIEPLTILYETFFPAPENGLEPRFDWLVERVAQVGFEVFKEDHFIKCPFPYLLQIPGPVRVERTKLGAEDKLYLPAGWSKRVLQFVKEGIVELKCRHSGYNQYTGRLWGTDKELPVDKHFVEHLAFTRILTA